MVKRIYSDIMAEVLIEELDGKRVHIWDEDSNYKNPSLVLPNLLAIKRLRDYLDKLIRKYPKYFEKVGEPILKTKKSTNTNLKKWNIKLKENGNKEMK